MPNNGERHRKQPTAKNPTTGQRIAWHLGHSKECACRPGFEKHPQATARPGDREPGKRGAARG